MLRSKYKLFPFITELWSPICGDDSENRVGLFSFQFKKKNADTIHLQMRKRQCLLCEFLLNFLYFVQNISNYFDLKRSYV